MSAAPYQSSPLQQRTTFKIIHSNMGAAILSRENYDSRQSREMGETSHPEHGPYSGCQFSQPPYFGLPYFVLAYVVLKFIG